MSLLSFLKHTDVRKRFRREFAKPKIDLQRDLLAPPLTQSYSKIGTAFDYLLRFYLQYYNSSLVFTKTWVAEKALCVIEEYIVSSNRKVRAPISDFRSFELNQANTLLVKGRKIVAEARQELEKFLKTGNLSDVLISCALRLADLDSIFRTGGGNSFFRSWFDFKLRDFENKKDIGDLRNLILLVDLKVFRASKLCMLNPTFGDASVLVGGADTDLIIDDMIIDVKTTQYLQLSRADFNQLIGYYALYKIGGVDGIPKKQLQITKAGIYFSRFGCLYTFDIDKIISIRSFLSFLQWFKKKASRAFPISASKKKLLKLKRDEMLSRIANSDFQTTFQKLKRILQKYEKRLLVKANEPKNYSLDAGYSEKYKREIFFGAVHIKKNYISFYLMPVYMFPGLLQGMSTGLKKRMQGKSCFNFVAVDNELFSELAQLTQKGFDKFREENLV